VEVMDDNASKSSSPSSPILGGSSDGLIHLFFLLNANRDYHNNKYNGTMTTTSLVMSKVSNVYATLPSLFTIAPRIMNYVCQFWKNKLVHLSHPLHYEHSKITLEKFLHSLSYQFTSSPASTQFLTYTSSACFKSLAFSTTKLLFHPKDTLEKAHQRKIEALLARAQISKSNMNILLIDTSSYNFEDNNVDNADGGNGIHLSSNWGILSARLAMEAVSKTQCKVYVITASAKELLVAKKYVENNNAFEKQQRNKISFVCIPNMTKKNCNALSAYAKQCLVNGLKFDRIVICDTSTLVDKAFPLEESRHFMKSYMDVHPYTPAFFSCVEKLLERSGILVLEATTTNGDGTVVGGVWRRNEYSTALPSKHGLMDAIYHGSTLTLEHMDNLTLHYSETLRNWRKMLNALQARSSSSVVEVGDDGMVNGSYMPRLDDMDWRAWNFFGSYCEAALGMNKLSTDILVLTRPGCGYLVEFNETNTIMQTSKGEKLTPKQVNEWLKEV